MSSTDPCYAVAPFPARMESAAIARVLLAIVASLGIACAARSSKSPAASNAIASPPVVEFAFVEAVPADTKGSRTYEHEGTTYQADELRRFRFATAAMSQDDLGWPAVSLTIDPRDATEFEHWTEKNVGRLLAVLLDGRVVTVATVHGSLPGAALIVPAQHWSENQATELATRIHATGTAAPSSEFHAGSRPAPFQLAAPYEPEPGALVVISLERTPCYGSCPVYTLLVRNDGSVWYHGEKFVSVVGEHNATLFPGALRRLLARFCAVDFFSLSDRSAGGLTDQASTILTLSVNGRTKRVEHYGRGGGLRRDDPNRPVQEMLDALAQAVDSETGSRRWVGP